MALLCVKHSKSSEGLSVGNASSIAETAVCILAPEGLLYSWHFYLTQMRKESPSWRNRVTLLSLALVSLAALLWPIMGMLMPRADWGSGLGVDHQVQWAESWHRPILRALLVALVLCFFGRPRLIAPIAIACVGMAILDI
jgi:hypothetical protein